MGPDKRCFTQPHGVLILLQISVAVRTLCEMFVKERTVCKWKIVVGVLPKIFYKLTTCHADIFLAG